MSGSSKGILDDSTTTKPETLAELVSDMAEALTDKSVVPGRWVTFEVSAVSRLLDAARMLEKLTQHCDNFNWRDGCPSHTNCEDHTEARRVLGWE